MVLVEECWRSWEKRRNRNWKVQMMMRGGDVLEGGLGAGVPTSGTRAQGKVKLGQVPEFVYSEWNAGGKEVRHTRSSHEAKARAVTERPPTDADDWDLAPHELFTLAAKFPGAVKVMNT